MVAKQVIQLIQIILVGIQRSGLVIIFIFISQKKDFNFRTVFYLLFYLVNSHILSIPGHDLLTYGISWPLVLNNTNMLWPFSLLKFLKFFQTMTVYVWNCRIHVTVYVWNCRMHVTVYVWNCSMHVTVYFWNCRIHVYWIVLYPCTWHWYSTSIQVHAFKDWHIMMSRIF